MKFTFSDNNNKSSLSNRFRSRRFHVFLSLLRRIPRPVTILDIGGTQEYWSMMGFNESNVSVILFNLATQPVTRENFSSVAGDATSLSGLEDASIDVVYSNSVIEHLFTWDSQVKMANEIRRVGRNYFIQTPNRHFFIEPHWVFPFFQFLPWRVRVWMTQHFALGHIGKVPGRAKAEAQVNEISLLNKRDMMRLFPEAKIYEEKFLFLTKSIVVYYFPD